MMFSGWKKIASLFLSALLPFIIVALINKNVRILDLIFSSLILVLFWSVTVLAIELDKQEKHESGPANRKRLRFDKEILFVMSKVAKQVPNNVGDVEIKRKTLADSYSSFFKGKDLRDFNGLISELAGRGYLDTTRNVSPDVYCIITKDGFEYYRKHLKKKRWIKELSEMGD